MLLFKYFLLYSVKSQQHIIIYHVLIRILHFLRKRRLKKWNQEGKEIQSILFSISSFNNRIIVQLEQLYDSIHFKTTFRTQKNSIMKNNSSSSLISHLEHNVIFNTCQVNSAEFKFSTVQMWGGWETRAYLPFRGYKTVCIDMYLCYLNQF